VLDRGLVETSEVSWSVLASARTMPELIAGFVSTLVDFFAGSPSFIAILRHESLLGSSVMVDALRERTTPILDAVLAAVRARQDAGDVRRDVAARELILASFSMIAHPFADAPIVEALLPGVAILPRPARLPLDLWELDLGADRYLRDGTTFPKDIAEPSSASARPCCSAPSATRACPTNEHARDILFGMRFGLDLYANVRPVRPRRSPRAAQGPHRASDVDVVVFRENTEGIYVGIGGQFKRGTPDEVAINEDVNTRKGVERIIRAGLRVRQGSRQEARAHGRQVERHAPRPRALAARVLARSAQEYPEHRGRTSTSTRSASTWCKIRAVRGDRHQQPLRRHRHRPRRRAPGRPRHGGQRQRARRRAGAWPVRARARLGPAPRGKDVANPFAALLTAGMMLTHLGYPRAPQPRGCGNASRRSCDSRARRVPVRRKLGPPDRSMIRHGQWASHRAHATERTSLPKA
jgi:3-isopropylmalate dehydrogenase